MIIDERDPAVKEIVEKMKATARAHASIPVLPPPRECYYHFKTGLSLCLTVDVLTTEWYQGGQRRGVKFTQGLAKGAKFWHLSITRVGAARPDGGSTPRRQFPALFLEV